MQKLAPFPFNFESLASNTAKPQFNLDPPEDVDRP